MCSFALQKMKAGLRSQNIEIQLDASTFNFAKAQQTLAQEKRRIWLSESPPLFTDFSIINEGNVPFLMSLPLMKNLGISLDLRRTPFLKGQGLLLHRD